MTAVDDRDTAEEPAEDGSVGAWEATFAGWRVIAPVVLVHAAVQAATVLADPVPRLSVTFVGLTLGSVTALLAAVWLLTGAAATAVTGRGRQVWRTAFRRPGVMVWALAVGVVAVAASLLAVWLLPVVLLVGAFLLPPAATGARNVPAAALRTLVHAPIRSLLLVLAGLVAAALSAGVALGLGLFVTGPLSAALLWVWLGVVGALLLCRYCVVTDRADRRR